MALHMGGMALPTIILTAFGPCDAGKSTLLGHLFLQLGLMTERERDRLQRDADEIGKGSFRYAFYFDRQRGERERGLTLNIHVKQMMSPQNDWTVIDTPGHTDFLKSQIRGLQMADVGLLVVPFVEHQFRSAFDREGMARQGLLAAAGMGVSRLVVAVTKMDLPFRGVDGNFQNDNNNEDEAVAQEVRFAEISAEVTALIGRLAPALTVDLVFVPVSGWSGHNLVRGWPDTTPVAAWYRGPTLIEALDDCAAQLRDSGSFKPDLHAGLPVRIPIADRYRIKGVGTVITGRVACGTLRPGAKLHLSGPRRMIRYGPGAGDASAQVEPLAVMSIERHHRMLENADCGAKVGICVQNAPQQYFITRGMVLSDAATPAVQVTEFIVRGMLFDHSPMKEGWTPIFDIGTLHICCRFVELLEKTPKGSKTIERHPQQIFSGDQFVARVRSIKPIVVEPYADNPVLGRGVVRSNPGRKIVAIVRVEQLCGDGAPTGGPSRMTKSANKTG